MRPFGKRAISLSRKIPRWDGTVQHLVAFPTKRDQVGFEVLSKCTAPSQVVNIEILKTPAYLTAPVIALQDLVAQPRIRDGRYSVSRSLL